MSFQKLIFRLHAVRRLFERNISIEDINKVIENGEVIEEYSNDKPYPSYLIMGTFRDKPLHVVAADNKTQKVTIIITVYEPDEINWGPGFRQRKGRGKGSL